MLPGYATGATNLTIIRYDCMNNKGLGDVCKAWVLLQRSFRSDETVTVVSEMQQLARLQPREVEALHNYFIRAQEVSARLEHEGNCLSFSLPNAMVLNGLPESYEHLTLTESFNPAGSVVELQKRLLSYEKSRKHRESVIDANSHVRMTSNKARPNHKSSS